MEQSVALVSFCIVTSVTPGPNNLLLWASGAEFGFRRSLRHVIGTALGVGAMAIAVAAGLGALVTAVPELELVMRVGGSAYLLYLAWQVAGAKALERGALAHPLGLVQAAAFQLINPKAWVFALGAMTTFRPAELPVAAGSLLVTVAMMAAIVPTGLLWACGGELIGRLLARERAHRLVSLALAALLVASVAYVWI